MKTLSAPPPKATFLGALKNIGSGLYNATAKFASYAAASPTATTRVGSRIGTNSNSTYGRIQAVGMNWTAEDMFKNSSLAAAYILQRINYCSALMTYIPGTGDAGLDAELKSYLQGDDGCGGIFGSMGVDCSMQDALSRTADIECPIRGDAGMILWEDASGELRLIEFSADQLGEIWSFTRDRTCGLSRKVTGEIYQTAGNDCHYFAGRYFRGADCVAYKIYERSDAWYVSPKIYDAADVIYFRDPSSFRGVRGVTKFATAIQHMEKGERLFQIGMDAAMRQAKTAMVVMNERGMPDEPSYETDIATDGRVTYAERIPNGPLVEYFYNGDSANFTSPDSPGPELIQGVETSDERVALALGLPYAFLVSATKVGGAPSRLEINKAAKEWQRIQNKIIRPKLSRIQRVVILNAVRRGLFPAHAHITRGRWVLPISPSVDAFYDTKENISMMRAGLESAQDIIAETNRDADDVLEKSKQWAIKCARKVEDANNELVRLGYKPTVTAADIAQVSDNPQQAAAAENLTQGKSATGDDNPQNKATGKMTEWDESKHKRGQPGNAGEFGSGGGQKKEAPKSDMKIYMQKQATHLHETAQSQGHADVNEFAANDPQGFSKTISDFQKNNPREGAATKRLVPSKERAWNGSTISVKSKLSKLETGALGEKAVIDYLKDQGYSDARTYETSRNNAPIDLLQDHELIEVKTGFAGNGDTAQHWRATIGQPGPEETKMLKSMSSEDKKKWNAAKAAQILKRKTDELANYSASTGRKANGKTITTIINSDTRTIDVFEFDGFHLRIPWKSPEAKAAYKGSYKY